MAETLLALASPPAAAAPPPAATAPPPAATAPPGPAPSERSPLRPRLEVPPYSLPAALGLERELGVGRVLAQVLVRRGLGDPAAAGAFLAADETHDAGRFEGLERVIATLDRHLRARSRITVYGDYDVDGVCATAILVRALRARGGEVDWFLPSRIDDGYGLSSSAVERLARRGTRLIVTVDCGITAVEQAHQAARAGVELVISDHHAPRPDGQLPDCPILHPALGGYPCPELCGAAVAHKLAEALGAPTAEEDLELVALATVADLVALRGENRRLVRQGLRALAVTTRPGLRALLEVARVDPSAVDAGVIGYRLAPRLNAAGRLRRADAGLELLLCPDPARAREIARELDLVNAERRFVEQRILWEAEAQVAEQGERAAYVLASEGWHPGVIGIVASRIVERVHRPAILVALEDADGTGSGRSISGFDLLGALHAAAPHLERYGGHRAAAGLVVRREALDGFRRAFERHAEASLTADLLTPVERVDAVVSGVELGLGLADELAALEPCGIGNPAPRLLVAGARWSDVRSMGEGRHASFSVWSGGARARAVAFGCEGSVAGDAGRPVDATFRLERNVYNGTVEPRLVLRHRWPCRAGSIEVLGEPDDYLAAVLAELDAPLQAPPEPAAGAGRTQLDRRGHAPLSVLRDAGCAGGGVLAVCADVPRRLGGLRERAAGFALISHRALAAHPQLARPFAHVVVLDPPSSPAQRALPGAGEGFAHLAWGEAELRFALQMHELEYGLRSSLVALYRELRTRGRAAGGELERLLRGEGPHGRSAGLAGRLIRVLAELELVRLDAALPALELADAAPTALERSSSYRAYARRYEEGRRFLSSASL